MDRLLGELGIPNDSTAGREQLEQYPETRRAQEDGDEFKAIAYWPVSLVDTYRKAEVDSGFVAKTSATGAALLPTGTTAQRPASPTTGMVRFNTDLNYLEEYLYNFAKE